MSDEQLKKDCEETLKNFLKLSEKDKNFIRGAIYMALCKNKSNKENNCK